MHSPSRITSLTLTTVLSAVAFAVAGCGGGGSQPAKTTAAKPASATTPAAATSTPASATQSGLSGTWAGQYGGAYSGTFKLNWRQSGSNLGGTIKLSAPAGTMSIHGTTDGGTIKFGTVGSMAITYSGTVSGGSMSGNYTTPGGGGSWSASKG